MTESLIDDEQGNFRAGTGCVDEIFTLKQIGEKTCRMYAGFMDLRRYIIGSIGRHYGNY